MAYEDVEFFPVESSNVSQIGYDFAEQVLYVGFNSGWMYYYYPVPQETYDAFLVSDSKGKFVHQVLKTDPNLSYGRYE